MRRVQRVEQRPPEEGLSAEQRERLEELAAAVPPDALPKTPEILALRAALLETVIALPADSFLRASLHHAHARLRVEGCVEQGLDVLIGTLEGERCAL